MLRAVELVVVVATINSGYSEGYELQPGRGGDQPRRGLQAGAGQIELESAVATPFVEQVEASATNPAFPGHTTYLVAGGQHATLDLTVGGKRRALQGGGIEVESMAVRAIVDEVSTGGATNPVFPGHTTYRCSLQLMGDARNVYTIYGTEADPMNIPGAFQTPAPFGANVGGVNPVFFAVPACGVGERLESGQGYACARDSWLTVGLTEGDPSSMLATIGVDWASWTEMQGITVDNGMVFWMSPDDGPTSSDADGKGPGLAAGNIVVAQITLLETHQATLRLNAQGRTTAPAVEVPQVIRRPPLCGGIRLAG